MSTHPGLRDEPIFLDYNATAPVDPRVVTALQPYLAGQFGTRPAPITTPPHPPTRCSAREQVAA